MGSLREWHEKGRGQAGLGITGEWVEGWTHDYGWAWDDDEVQGEA